jgi:hypothetical protein
VVLALLVGLRYRRQKPPGDAGNNAEEDLTQSRKAAKKAEGVEEPCAKTRKPRVSFCSLDFLLLAALREVLFFLGFQGRQESSSGRNTVFAAFLPSSEVSSHPAPASPVAHVARFR